MKISIIIQARMESTRLWGKVLLPTYYERQSILQAMCMRLKCAREVNDAIEFIKQDALLPYQIIIAMPISSYSHIIEEQVDYADHFYKGKMNDILSRVLNAAYSTNTNIIVDLTGDCPLISPSHIKKLIGVLLVTDADYVSNVNPRTWPDGCDIQVYTTKALEKVNKLVTNPKHREHSGWNILQYPNEFKIINEPAPKKYNHPEIGLTLDTKEDYLLLNKIYKHFSKTTGNALQTPIEEIIDYVLANEDLLKINNNAIRKTPGKG